MTSNKHTSLEDFEIFLGLVNLSPFHSIFPYSSPETHKYRSHKTKSSGHMTTKVQGYEHQRPTSTENSRFGSSFSLILENISSQV